MHMAMPPASAKTRSPVPQPGSQISQSGSQREKPGFVQEGARMAGEALAGAGQVIAEKGLEVVKDGAGSLVANALAGSFLYPIRQVLQLPPVQLLGQGFINKLIKKLADKLKDFAEKGGIKLEQDPASIIHECLYGDLNKVSSEMITLVSNSLKQVLPDKLSQAIESGNPLTIAKQLASFAGSGIKGIGSEINQINSRFGWLTKPFIWLGQKLPLINRAPQSFQPWIAGFLSFGFGGFLIRKAFQLIKWLVLAGGAALGINFVMKKFGSSSASA